MIVIAAQTLRSRWRLFLGSFVALAFGVTLVGSAGLLLAAPELAEMGSLLGTVALISCFSAVFVVAGTQAFSVEQRRRELALLRAVGATPWQIRRLIVGETLGVGAVAAAVGCVLAVPAAAAMVDGLMLIDWLPPGAVLRRSATATEISLGVAFVVGLVVARLSAAAAARRAGRTRPIEALRAATLQGRVMTLGRWVTGLVFTGLAVAMLMSMPTASQDGAMIMSIAVVEVIVVALSALAPLYVSPLVRLVGLPASRLTHVTGLLATESVRTGTRRTASTMAPALVTVALFGAFIGLGSTINVSDEVDVRTNVVAAFVVEPARAEPGPDAATAMSDVPRRIKDLEGVRATLSFPLTDLTVVGSGVPGEQDEEDEDAADSLDEVPYPAVAVDPGSLPSFLQVRTRAGSLADLSGDGVAVTSMGASEQSLRMGQHFSARLASGEVVQLRVVAIVDLPPVVDATFLVPQAMDDGWPVDRVLVASTPEADQQGVAAALRTAVGPELKAWSTDDWAAKTREQAERMSWLGVLVLLGMSLVYTVIAIANTQLMAAAERGRDITILRRVGATPAQAIRMVAWEAGASVGAGVLVGMGAAMVTIFGVSSALRMTNPEAVVVVPWESFLGAAVLCITVAVVAAVGSVWSPARGPIKEKL